MAANGMYDAEANATLDARIGSTATLALMTTMPSASGGTASGTKVVGGSYTDQAAVAMAAAASRQKSNSGTVTFAGMPDTNGVGGVKGVDLGGKWFMPYAAPKLTSAGDSIIHAAGSIVAAFNNGT